MATYFRQCDLSREGTRQTSWIPEEFAEEGRFVSLKVGDAWEQGWRVDAVGASRRTDDFVRAHERDHLAHRARTDI